MSKTEAPVLQVVARAPFHVYYEGPAYSLSATNRIGVFDVLPGHADFFSMLVPCTVTIDTEQESVSFEIYSGMLTVKNDEAMLFVNM
ncbi:hypothetical protein IPM09_05325 [Candidatus Saccharibacteria bacterium]|nr:MAG: hypothetical protein IPM09_05325 [Candidatus Saccharibacteria bacterium]